MNSLVIGQSSNLISLPCCRIRSHSALSTPLVVAFFDGILQISGVLFPVLRRNSWEGAIHAALLKTTNSVLVAAIR
jgi:hypothetical protein